MPGLAVTAEETSAQVAALIREMEGYEARAASARVDKNEDLVEKWENRAEQVREQLAARGSTPHLRASKRAGRQGAETRA